MEPKQTLHQILVGKGIPAALADAIIEGSGLTEPEHLEYITLDVINECKFKPGQIMLIKAKLGLQDAPSPAAHVTGAPPVAHGPIQVTLHPGEKAPRDMRESDLLAAFCDPTRRDSEVILEVNARFGAHKLIFVMNADGTINLPKTIERRGEEDDGDVYDGLEVVTPNQALDRQSDADPLTGEKLRKGFKAPDGVVWPAKPAARKFVVYCRRKKLAGVHANMDTSARQQLASSLVGFPDQVPPHFQDALVKFMSQRSDNLVDLAACEAELRYNPQNTSTSSTNGGGNTAAPQQQSGEHSPAPPLKGDPVTLMKRLFDSLFMGSADFKRHVFHCPETNGLWRDLPGEATSSAQFYFEGALLIQQRGQAKAFLNYLKSEYQGRAHDIQRIIDSMP